MAIPVEKEFAFSLSQIRYCRKIDGLNSGNSTFMNADYSNMLLLSNVNNSIIFNNTMKNGDNVGIGLYGSYYNTISKNIIKNNSYNGIKLGESGHNRISENVVSSNGNGGICINQESYYNNISKNIANDNVEYGIFIQYSDNNHILENNASNNGIFGIGLGISDYNIVVGNNIEKNHQYGIYIVNSASDSNQLYRNIFKENLFNARDDGFNNQWDNGSIGNYWDDNGGVDANDDGIGDTPYDVPSFGGSMDNYPIWRDGDDISPDIPINSLPFVNITSHINQETMSGLQTINITAASPNIIVRVEFWINGFIKWIDNSEPFNFTWNTTTVIDDTYMLEVSAIDNLGQRNSTWITLNVNNGLPLLNITSHVNQEIVSGLQTINITAASPNEIVRVEFWITISLYDTNAILSLNRARLL